jgi:hypothetical protein
MKVDGQRQAQVVLSSGTIVQDPWLASQPVKTLRKSLPQRADIPTAVSQLANMVNRHWQRYSVQMGLFPGKVKQHVGGV